MKKYEINTFIGANILESIKSLCIGDIKEHDLSVYNINGQNIWYYFDGKIIATSANFRRMKEYVESKLGLTV